MGEKQLPELYPGWKTVRKIGAGSFGTVYEIERDLFGRIEKAALKCITIPQNDSDVEEMYSNGYDEASITAHFENYLSNIVREYSLMAEMKGHTNVVYCDDIRYVSRGDGIGWDITIKMELLTPLIRALGPNFGEDLIIRLGTDICRALVLCRDREIVHRDIKPQNIFVSKTGDYKLGDFGIAKTVERTTGGTKIGTYSFMAPEVYHSKPYGSSADLYSLGLVMYWLLNERRLPFLPLPPKSPTYEETETARHRRFMGEKLPEPKNGSEELKKIVLKACAFDPKDRYASAQEMLEALNGLPDVLEESVPAQKNSEILAQTEIEDDRTVGLFTTHKSEYQHVANPESTPKIETKAVPKPESGRTSRPVLKTEPRHKSKIPLFAAIVGVVLIIAVLLINPFGTDIPSETTSKADPILPDVPAPLGNYLRSDHLELKADYAYHWVAESAECSVFGSEIKRGEIRTVTFMDTLNDMGEDAWDVSEEGDGSVLAWVKPNGEYYDLFIAADGGVNAGKACADLFAGYINLESILFSNCFHTDGAESMARMFFGCSKLNQIDCLRFETSDVKDMSRMFFKCSDLEQLDLSSFNTASVETMYYMFWRCLGLTELNLSSFDTSSVKTMSGMFEWCGNLEQIDLSSFDTASVEEMQSMFSYCLQLSKLDLSHFDTAKVKNMSTMFHYCESLRELDISSFRTDNVEQASWMFYNCKELKKLDVSGFDTSNMVDMGQMFSWCISLDGLDLSGFDTSSAENMSEMFYCCPCVTVDQVSHFSTKKVMRYDWFMNGSDWIGLFE